MVSEYALFFRSGLGMWHKCVQQSIYINDREGHEYIRMMDMEELNDAEKPSFLRGTPMLMRIERYGPRGPSRWEGQHALDKLKTISGCDKIDPSKRPKRTENPDDVVHNKTDQVNVPQRIEEKDEEQEEDVWGTTTICDVDPSDYAAEDELYA